MPEKIETRLAVRVHPGAKRNEVLGFRGEALELKIAAPPVKGRANAELVAFLAAVLGVPRADVVVLRGEASRNKLVRVTGLGTEEIAARLRSAMGEKGKGEGIVF